VQEKNGLRGFYANKEIEANKIIIAVPNNLVIST
jgi:hypothetical protein